ncbi:hypothetical protein PORCAN_2201 [Porphyromonas crevioricanis JCM 13913]|nr:hypothetical protein PORCAN_2201 [Porphyromonas crevioricanis JCM 13913]
MTPNTSYYAVAMGMNADNEWGKLTKVEFKTLASKSAPVTPKSKSGVIKRDAK